MPLRDGTELATFVFLPPAAGPFPVVFVRTPYDASGNKGVMEWTDRGLAYVKQDVRGCFLSDGEHISFVNEEADGADALEWISRQPWCNGQIAMYGGSYVAATQISAALSGNTALKCITPCLIGAELYHMSYWGGALRWRRMEPGQAEIANAASMEAEMLAKAKESKFAALAHPRFDEYWTPHSPLRRMEAIQAPSFIRTGWYDLFVNDVFDFYNAARDRAGSEVSRKYTRILVGPWPHNINQQVVGEEDFGSAAVIADLYEQEMSFIEYFTGLPSAYDPEVAPLRLFIQGANQWRDEYEWPLARTQWTEYFLRGNGRANTSLGDGKLGGEPGGESDHFSYDPAHPVPTLGGAWAFTNIGPCDQSRIELRQDVLVYDSEELGEDLEVTGPVEVRVFASSSAEDTDFTAKLVDVRLDGRAMSVTDGIVRAQYRHPAGPAEKLVPGQIYEFSIRCNPTAYLFKQGHKIRLEISSSNFPAFSRNLNTGEPIGASDRSLVAHQTIHHSADYPSRLILPVIPPAPLP